MRSAIAGGRFAAATAASLGALASGPSLISRKWDPYSVDHAAGGGAAPARMKRRFAGSAGSSSVRSHVDASRQVSTSSIMTTEIPLPRDSSARQPGNRRHVFAECLAERIDNGGGAGFYRACLDADVADAVIVEVAASAERSVVFPMPAGP